jgi:spermidine synthase
MAAFVTVLAFLSGMVTVAYGVVWVNVLGLALGASWWEVCGVVATGVTGLAAGAALVSQWAPRLRRQLRLFALGEGVAALAALATPAALHLLVRLASRLGPDPLAGSGLPLLGRFAVAAAFLAVPSVALGAAAALLVERAGGEARLAKGVSRLAAAGLAGAATGVALTGFFALRVLGERGTLTAAATGGLLVAGAGWFADGAAPQAAPVGSAELRKGPRGWFFFPAVVGFVTLAFAIVSTRVLLLHLGRSSVVITTVLAILLAALGAGARLAGAWRGDAAPALAACGQWLALGLAVEVVVLAHFAGLRGWLGGRSPMGDFGDAPWAAALAVLMVLILPSLACGGAWPLAVAATGVGGGQGRRAGATAAAHGLGAAAGSVGGCVLVPPLGSQGTLLLLGLASLAAGTMLARSRGQRAIGLAAAVALAAPLIVLPGGLAREALRGGKGTIVALREGASSTVVVRRLQEPVADTLALEVDGAVVGGGSSRQVAIAQLEAYLPLLLHGAPRRVLEIGFGAGGAALALAQQPLAALWIAEPSAALLDLAGERLEKLNHGVLRERRVRVLENEGRNALLGLGERFDVILSRAGHPVTSGDGRFYTREYFALCRERLRPGGVVAARLPLASLDLESYLAIVRAFTESFPVVCVWYDAALLDDVTILTGSSGAPALRVRWSALQDRRVTPALDEAGIRSPEDLAGMLLLGPHEVAAMVGHVLPYEDDFPQLEPALAGQREREATWKNNLLFLFAARTRRDPFAALPGNYVAAAAARDRAILAQVRALEAALAARP